MKVFALVLPDDDSAGDAPGFVAAAAGLAQSLAASLEVLVVGKRCIMEACCLPPPDSRPFKICVLAISFSA